MPGASRAPIAWCTSRTIHGTIPEPSDVVTAACASSLCKYKKKKFALWAVKKLHVYCLAPRGVRHPAGARSFIAADLRQEMDKDTWIFTPMGERPPPGSFNMCVISTHQADNIHVIDEPENSGIRTQLRSSLLQAGCNILRETEHTEGCQEFKIQGYPWCYRSSVFPALTVLVVLQGLAKLGWHVYTTTDIATVPDTGGYARQGNYGDGKDKDTWVLMRHNTPSP
eukprot:TRINITY_DN68206_c8_g2_i3.p1 TRINITY_DN68206_c8_g2~~TRINITY_DN68206_c8_g2_i3.p1  ORF type:complete len:225 (-),score=8.73 TRINITY_DN68206_c8_g2_i3:138-812(-)